MAVFFQEESQNKLTFCYENSDIIPQELIDHKLFKGEKETSFITLSDEGEITMWVGLGNKDNTSALSLFRSGMHVVEKIVLPRKIDHVKVLFPEEISPEDIFFLAEGILSGSLYTYSLKEDRHQDSTELAHVTFESHQSVVQAAYTIAQSRNITRELIDTPPNLLSPSKVAEYVESNLSQIGVETEIWDKTKLEEENLQGILAVGQGSANEPCLVKATYSPSGAKKRICLIGKGITYDSGGYALKPNSSMKNMKADMGGAATMIGLLYGIVQMNLPLEVVVYLPLAENMVSGSAFRSGDVITYRNGKTVEVTNTDAEGRLVLADALILASEESFDLVVDTATLTGAIGIALGSDYHGVFANPKGLEYAQSYSQFSCDKTSEMGWLMPLHSLYKSSLKSSIADLQNTGIPQGGAINAAVFLNEFVKENQPWMHLDIAGVSFDSSKEGTGKATGAPVEALLLFLGSKFLEQ